MAITTAIRDRILREAPELQLLIRDSEDARDQFVKLNSDPSITPASLMELAGRELERIYARAGATILDLLENASE